MGSIDHIEGLNRKEIDFFFADGAQWQQKDKDFYNLIHGFHVEAHRDDFADIITLPTLYAKASAIRQWRYAMLQAGHSWQQLRDREMDIVWPTGQPPLLLPRGDNVFSLPFDSHADAADRDELIMQNGIMMLQDLQKFVTVQVTRKQDHKTQWKFNDALYQKWLMSWPNDLPIEQVLEIVDAHDDLYKPYAAMCKRDYAYAPLNAMIGMDKLIAEIEEIDRVVSNIKKGPDKEQAGIAMNFAISARQGMGKSQSVEALSRVLFRLGLIGSASVIKKSHQDLNTRGLKDKDTQLVALAFERAVKKGGTLFFDEVNHLDTEEGGPVSVINIQAEDQRGKIALVIATYPEEMQVFLRADPGLKGRFRQVAFDDLTAAQAVEIFEELAGQSGFQIPDNADGQALRSSLWTQFNTMQKDSMIAFDNGRAARNLLDKILGLADFPDEPQRDTMFNDMVCRAPILTKEMLDQALNIVEERAQAKTHNPNEEVNPFAQAKEQTRPEARGKVISLHPGQGKGG